MQPLELSACSFHYSWVEQDANKLLKTIVVTMREFSFTTGYNELL